MSKLVSLIKTLETRNVSFLRFAPLVRFIGEILAFRVYEMRRRCFAFGTSILCHADVSTPLGAVVDVVVFTAFSMVLSKLQPRVSRSPVP